MYTDYRESLLRAARSLHGGEKADDVQQQWIEQIHGVVTCYDDVYLSCFAIVIHLCLYWFAGGECPVLKQTISQRRTARWCCGLALPRAKSKPIGDKTVAWASR